MFPQSNGFLSLNKIFFSPLQKSKKVFLLTGVTILAIASFITALPARADAAILDTISGSANGYSIRQLKAAYSGPLVRVRRTDSAVADVYPDSNGRISSTSPITIISGGSGETTFGTFYSGTSAYVSIWYDQVGSANLLQSTTSAQPQIVNAGSLVTSGTNSRPTLQFNGSTSFLGTAVNVVFPQPAMIFSISSGGTQTGSPRMFEIGTTDRILYQFNAGMYAGGFFGTSVTSTPYSILGLTMLFNTTSSQLWSSGGGSVTGSVGTNTINGLFYLGSAYGGGSPFNGTISEYVIFTTNLSSGNRQAFEANEVGTFINATVSSTVTVQAASGVSDGATLNGTITATGGSPASFRGFEYGLTTAYGTTYSEAGSFSTGTFSTALTGLGCNTTYHYRAFATNTAGTSYSSDQAFTTDCPTATTILGVGNGMAAYSLRKIVSGYSGPVMRIRRTDGEKADVSFDINDTISSSSPITVVSGVSTATTLGTFTASTNAFVEILYDQASNYDLSQSSTSAQPQIVSSGAVITAGPNNQPAIQFNGTTSILQSSIAYIGTQPTTVEIVNTAGTQQPAANPRLFEFGGSSNRILYQTNSGMFGGTFLGSTILATPYATQQHSMLFNTTASQFWANTLSIGTGSVGSNTINGTMFVGSAFTGTISELVVYNTGLSTVNRQSVETSQMNYFVTAGAAPSTQLRITTPLRSVTASPSTATRSYLDQGGNTVYIPYIQTSTTLSVAAQILSSQIPSGGGVKFVLNEGLATEHIAYDMSAPFAATFTGLTKGDYVLDTYVVNSSNVVQSGSLNHDQATSIGIGDIFVAIGDSITKGAGGVSGTGCSASGTVLGAITNWTQSLAGTVSTDNRNYCQWSVQDPQYFKSWMPEFNNELASYLGYPVFILNEGYGGYTAAGYLTSPMGLTAWQNRVNSLSPNKFMVMLGTNDNTSTSTLVSNMTGIVNTLISTYGASASNVYLALPPYAASRPVVQTYVAPLQAYVASASLGVGPNFNTYFFNHPELFGDTPAIHPTATGYLQMARLWALSMIYPKNFTVTQSGANANATWTSLALTDAIPTGTSNLTGYNVYYGTSPGTYGTTSDAGNATSKSITGLTGGQQYYFTLRAYDADSDFSAAAPEMSLTMATVPGAPTSVSAVAGNAQATVSFTAPVSTGGSAITGYTVTSSPGGITATGSASPITVTGLTNGTPYTFTVTATNAIGTGSASSASNSVTPTTPDSTAPVISEVTPVTTPTTDNTPNYTFTTDEAGTITYGGSCSSATSSASIGSNTITFNTLVDGTYSNCTITVTDASSNASSALSVTTFRIDTTAPTVSSLSPIDNATGISPLANLVMTFNEAVTVNTGNILIKKTSDNSTVETISVASGQVTGTGTTTITINPSVTLASLTGYYVQVDSGAFRDAVLQSYGGISSTTAWSFTTSDADAPTVTNITSTKTNGTYTVGEVIDVVVTFSEAVTSTGNITVTLETGATDRTCTFSVTNATSGSCNYTVQAGDTSADLTVASISGTIADQAANAMTDFAPATNLAVNKAIVIDTTAPTLSETTPVVTPANDTTPNYSFTSNEAGTITYGGSCSSATSSATSGLNTVTLNVLSEGTYSNCTITVTDSISNISSPLSISAFTIDVTAPTITTITSTKANGTYGVGEVIDIVATFAEAVTSTGLVTITLETGTTDRTCTFSISNATSGSCNYTVQAGDTSLDLSVSSISGTIADQAANPMTDFIPASNLEISKALVIDTSVITPTPTPVPTTSSGGGVIMPFIFNTPAIPAQGYRIIINQGATTTNSRVVSLGFIAGSDITKVAVSTKPDFSDAVIEMYQPNMPFDLCGSFGGTTQQQLCPKGTYTVYAKFYTSSGGTTAGIGASSTVTLLSGLEVSTPLLAVFSKTLKLGQTNPDVKRLQQFLNQYPDTRIAQSGPGSPGKETSYFGPATKRAVILFQEKYAKEILSPFNLTSGTGFVGQGTLKKINQLINTIGL